MPIESYADFSIVQRYIDQKKLFDEELSEYKLRIEKLETEIKSMKGAGRKKAPVKR